MSPTETAAKARPKPTAPQPARLRVPLWAVAALGLVALAVFFAALPSPADSDDGEATTTATRTVPSGTFVITGARVFDGQRTLGTVDVRVEDGRVAEIGAPGETLEAAGVARVPGSGHTLLPGLIDSHVHAMGGGPEQAIRFGVTTVLDMFADPAWVGERKATREAAAPAAAAVFSAGHLATVAGGHGTQFGLPVPTLEVDTDARAWVADRLAEGSDFVKIVVEDGHTLGRPLPTLSMDQVADLADAAHAHGVLAVAHVGSKEEAHGALAAGIDGLVHLFLDEAPDAALLAAAGADGDGPAGRRQAAFVVPTLTVLASVAGQEAGAAFADDPRVAPRLTRDQRTGLERTFDIEAEGTLENARATVRRLAATGVPILVGSDAPNPGTAHGASVHHELELLVEAGLSAEEALTAATAAPAAAFGLDDRGRIAPGLRADLVLVAGDPTADITASRDLVAVWQAGQAVDLAPPAEPEPAAAPRIEPGLVSDFSAGIEATLGVGRWVGSTDQRMGGASTVELEAVDGALRVRGEIRPGFAFPWSGAFLMTHNAQMEPADLSAVHALAFRAKAGVPDGGSPTPTLRTMVFAPQLGMTPGSHNVELTETWQRYELPLATFGVSDGQVSAFLLGAEGEPGAFELWIDDVELVAHGAGDSGGQE